MRIHAISDSLTIKKNNIDYSGVGEFIFHGSAPPHVRKFPPLLFFSSTIQPEKHSKHSGKAHQSMNKISSNDEWSYELPAVTVIGIYCGSFSAAFTDIVRHCANEFWFEFSSVVQQDKRRKKNSLQKHISVAGEFEQFFIINLLLRLLLESPLWLCYSPSLCLLRPKYAPLPQRLRSDEKDVILHATKV